MNRLIQRYGKFLVLVYQEDGGYNVNIIVYEQSVTLFFLHAGNVEPVSPLEEGGSSSSAEIAQRLFL